MIRTVEHRRPWSSVGTIQKCSVGQMGAVLARPADGFRSAEVSFRCRCVASIVMFAPDPCAIAAVTQADGIFRPCSWLKRRPMKHPSHSAIFARSESHPRPASTGPRLATRLCPDRYQGRRERAALERRSTQARRALRTTASALSGVPGLAELGPTPSSGTSRDPRTGGFLRTGISRYASGKRGQICRV